MKVDEREKLVHHVCCKEQRQCCCCKDNREATVFGIKKKKMLKGISKTTVINTIHGLLVLGKLIGCVAGLPAF